MITRARAQEKRRRLILFLRIPSETWTDVFKMFPRRTLVQIISPVCYRLKEICNRNVKTIHVIKQANQFIEKLQQGDPEANQQLEHLTGNNCKLTSQFRISRINIIPENTANLRHCIDLLHGCQLSFYPTWVQNAAFFDDCLTQLEPANPIVICICLYKDPKFQFNQILRHPTIWNCNRIKVIQLPFWSVEAMPIAMAFLDWLHHQQPTEVNDSDDGVKHEEVRCLIIQFQCSQGVIDWLINACIQNFQQSQGPKDRRRFVISLFNRNRSLDHFERRHNQMSGEVILLEPDVAAAPNQYATVYRLRRCLAEEADNGRDFYGKTFKRNGPWDDFVVSEDDGPRVEID